MGSKDLFFSGLLNLLLFQYTFKTMNKTKEYFKKLFDFSFKESVTIGFIKGLYWINVIIGGVLAALTVRAGFEQSVLLGVLAVIFSPIVFGVYLLILRVLLEAVSVVFQVSENIKRISNILEGGKRKEVKKYKVKDKNNEE